MKKQLFETLSGIDNAIATAMVEQFLDSIISERVNLEKEYVNGRSLIHPSALINALEAAKKEITDMRNG